MSKREPPAEANGPPSKKRPGTNDSLELAKLFEPRFAVLLGNPENGLERKTTLPISELILHFPTATALSEGPGKLETAYDELNKACGQTAESRPGQLRIEHNQLETKYDQLETEHKQLETEHKQLETEHKQLETKHKQLEAERDKSVNARRQLETEHKQLETEHKQLEAERDKSVNARRQLETEHKQLKTEHEQLETEQKQLQAERHESVNGLDQLQKIERLLASHTKTIIDTFERVSNQPQAKFLEPFGTPPGFEQSLLNPQQNSELYDWSQPFGGAEEA
jgi:predicted  nucleic acid-binding Zn-ribbon protein